MTELPTRLPRGEPKGQALRAILEGLLGSLPPGASLPSERDLAERYGLARMTVRNEIERLTAAGSVYRLHGRGTFVAEPRIAQAGALTSFTEDMLARGHEPGSTVTSSELVAADGFLAAALEVKPGDTCFRLDRVRTADGRPMAIERVYLPLERFEGIDRVDFTDTSLFDVLEGAFGVSLGDAEQRVVAVAIEPDEAPLLGVAEASPGLRFHTVTRDRAGAPALYAVSLYPGDRYEVALRQTRE
jgi:DNA-binding GntR family transcriptional regulator